MTSELHWVDGLLNWWINGLSGIACMEEMRKKKYQVGNLTMAFWLSCLGFACFLASIFSFYQDFVWVEKQRVHPDVNPVVYAGVLELLHYSWLFLVLLGTTFPSIALFIWKDRRERKREQNKVML
jgi:hypothetical protein